MIPIKIMTQPDDVTCGPTSLHAVYNYFGDSISLEQVIEEVAYLETGGTLAVLLGCHALARGYDAELFSYNLEVFDPSWFQLSRTEMLKKLQQQMHSKNHPKILHASKAYCQFLEMGGSIKSHDPTPRLLRSYFRRGLPVLTGLSATYLYQTLREYTTADNKTVYDDINGHPSGHFVVLSGYDKEQKHVVVADPYKANTITGENYYSVKVSRLINAIMLGIITYDANLLIIQPKASNPE